MLTKDAKRVLNIINSICNNYKSNYPDKIAYVEYITVYIEYRRLYLIEYRDLVKIIEYLIDTKYISTYKVGTADAVTVEYKGQRYKEFGCLELKSFFFKSIVVPIIVASIITLITLFITGIFNNQGN
jgi:hypothetical protein